MIIEYLIKIIAYLAGMVRGIGYWIANNTNPIVYDIFLIVVAGGISIWFVSKFWKAFKIVWMFIKGILLLLILAGVGLK